MNKALHALGQRTSHLQRFTVSGHFLPACQINNWFRPVRYELRKRREDEYFRYPERAKPVRRNTFLDWNQRAELYAFGQRVGEAFKEDLLQQAFVDKSYVYTERKRQEELGLDPATIQLADNEDLAAEGRHLIREILTIFLRKEFPKLPNDGVEAVISRLMNPAVLGNVSSLLGAKDLVQCSDYPPSAEVLTTAFEAIVGALHQSSGRERVDKFIVDFVASHLCGKDIHDFWDIPKPWHLLLDITKGKSLEPRLLREAGRHTLLSAFVVGIYDENKQLMGTGVGETVDIAQEMAARDVLRGVFGTKAPLKPFEFQSSNFPIQLIPHVRHPYP